MILAVTWTLKHSILAFSVLVWMCSLYFLLIHFNELASFSIISTKCLITKRIKRWREERKAPTGRESWGVGWAVRNVCRGWRANGAAVAADHSLLHQLLAGGGSYKAGSSIFTDCLKKNAIKWWPKIWGFVVTRWREWELRRRMKESSGRSCSAGGCQRKARGAAETGSKLPLLQCRRVTGPARTELSLDVPTTGLLELLPALKRTHAARFHDSQDASWGETCAELLNRASILPCFLEFSPSPAARGIKWLVG